MAQELLTKTMFIETLTLFIRTQTILTLTLLVGTLVIIGRLRLIKIGRCHQVEECVVVDFLEVEVEAEVVTWVEVTLEVAVEDDMKAYGKSDKFYKGPLKQDHVKGRLKKEGYENWWEETAQSVDKKSHRQKIKKQITKDLSES